MRFYALGYVVCLSTLFCKTASIRAFQHNRRIDYFLDVPRIANESEYFCFDNDCNGGIVGSLFFGPSAQLRHFAYSCCVRADRAGWMFSDTLKGDYRLTLGSPAIDSAEVISGVTDGYVGSKPDLGAYEYGGTAWVPGHTWGEVPSLSPIAYQGSVYNLAALQAPRVRIGMQSIQVQLQGSSEARVRVINVRGALVREVAASQSQRTVLLSTRGIASGWYLLQVVSGTHHINQPFLIAR